MGQPRTVAAEDRVGDDGIDEDGVVVGGVVDDGIVDDGVGDEGLADEGVDDDGVGDVGIGDPDACHHVGGQGRLAAVGRGQISLRQHEVRRRQSVGDGRCHEPDRGGDHRSAGQIGVGQVGQPGAVAVERAGEGHARRTVGQQVGRQLRRGQAAGDARRRDAPAQLAGVDHAGNRRGAARRERIGRGRDLLPGRQGGEDVRSMGAHGQGQPVAPAHKHAGAEIHQRREQPLGHHGGGVRHRPGQHGAALGVGVERERQVVAAVGRRAIGNEPALIGEGRALGLRGREESSQHAGQAQPCDGDPGVFHGTALLQEHPSRRKTNLKDLEAASGGGGGLAEEPVGEARGPCASICHGKEKIITLKPQARQGCFEHLSNLDLDFLDVGVAC